MKTDLSQFDNSWYKPGGKLKKLIWYFCNILFMKNPLWPHSGSKVALLRLFGAKMGKSVLIKPNVNIKYPWKLTVGDHVWIGEEVWIDNLGHVTIESNCCLSQGALLLCGNHDYSKVTFDLMVGDIHLQQGTWIGAKAIVTGGVTTGEESVLSVGSVASKSLDAFGIYRGSPAVKVKERTFKK
ncbi:MAG: WcaF family extracellular polysaccharide biosynthesis acetyltransferase [Bacteroidota bacterium]